MLYFLLQAEKYVEWRIPTKDHKNNLVTIEENKHEKRRQSTSFERRNELFRQNQKKVGNFQKKDCNTVISHMVSHYTTQYSSAKFN